jgi:hypothetical protein
MPHAECDHYRASQCRQNIYHDKFSLSCGQVEQSVDIRYLNGFLFCSQGDALRKAFLEVRGLGMLNRKVRLFRRIEVEAGVAVENISVAWTGRKVWLKIVASVGRNASFARQDIQTLGGLNLSAKGSLKGSPFVGCVRLAQKSRGDAAAFRLSFN